MAAPTFVAEYETVVNTTTSPKTISVTTAVGDVLVVFGVAENRLVTLGTPSGGTGSWSAAAQEVTATPTSDWCSALLWTKVATAAETFTLSITRTGDTGQNWGYIVMRWSGSAGVGASSKGNVSGAAPSLNLTTTGANSAVCAAFSDWNALATSRTWRTVNGSVGTEQMYVNVSGRYTAYANRWNDVGAAGVKTTGLSAPTGQKWSGVAVEILGSTSSTTVSPSGIASGAALGSPSISGTVTVSPTGIGSGQALGTPTVTPTITVSPTGIASGQALGSPAISGTVTVSPGGIASAAAVGTPAIIPPPTTVSPSGIASGQALGAPSVSMSTTVSPGGVASGETLGAPSISGTVTVSPAGIGTGEQFGAPTVSGTITVSPAGVGSGEAVGSPSITGSITVSPSGIASSAAVGTPTAVFSNPDVDTPWSLLIDAPVSTLTVDAPAETLEIETGGGWTIEVAAPTPETLVVDVPALTLEVGVPALTLEIET